ncbi:SIS domain-containing protein [Micromonospora sp. NPDC049679]|uniref:D-sedoheptulose-7-phosphate isomerase n=1 Tax=Micromonospora sp. NPDC049679 TaxID=3155920 RepID=UPI00340AC7F4
MRPLDGRLVRGRLLAFGNGGSSTDAQELVRLFVCADGGVGGPAVPGGGGPSGRPRALPAIALANDVAVVTGVGNDVGYEAVFSRQIAVFGRARDIAIGLSTGGTPANLVRAFEAADRRGMLTVGIAGHDGGRMAELDTVDYLFVVPSPSLHRVQEAQTTIYHALWELTMGERARR